MARDFCLLLEAGYISQLLMMYAPEEGLNRALSSGLSGFQTGTTSSSAEKRISHELLHTLLGGRVRLQLCWQVRCIKQ